MPIDFHDPTLRFTYASRQADPGWLQSMKGLFDFSGKRVADIGCGGGIYAKALAELGAREVIALDYSEEMLKGLESRTATHAFFFAAGMLMPQAFPRTASTSLSTAP